MLRFLAIVCAVLGLMVVAALMLVAARPTLAQATDEVDVYAGRAVNHVVGRLEMRDRQAIEARVCLALNAYHEARGEAWAGQVAVGQVALRRAGLDALRVCREIYLPGQFSWTSGRPRGSSLPTGAAWQRALTAADAAMWWAAHGGEDYSNGATFYHATSVSPYWIRGLELVAMLGEHRFYR